VCNRKREGNQRRKGENPTGEEGGIATPANERGGLLARGEGASRDLIALRGKSTTPARVGRVGKKLWPERSSKEKVQGGGKGMGRVPLLAQGSTRVNPQQAVMPTGKKALCIAAGTKRGTLWSGEGSRPVEGQVGSEKTCYP